MNKSLLLAIVVGFALGARASGQESTRPVEALVRWPLYQEIGLPNEPTRGACQFLLNEKVLNAARGDLNDLRLFDPAGREVPYALRVRQPRNEERGFPAREFNRVTHPDRSVEVTLDLGDAGGEHNRVEVATGGANYRRLLKLEGSDDGKQWKPILDRRPLTYFSHEGQTFDGRQVSYSPSRFRYLRVRVAPDPALADDAPEGPRVRVLHTVRVAGLERPWPAVLSPRSPVRESTGGDYASEWFVALPGKEQVPWQKLEFDAEESEFVRTYELEDASAADGNPRHLSSGEWQRSAGKRERLVVALPSEVTARRLRLVVIDQRNPPLTLKLVSATAAARQVIFERPADGPLRLYFGNPEAVAPGYDYARTLPDRPDVEPAKAEPGEVHANPSYEPPPQPRPPLTERSPATTYVVFAVVAVVLCAILAWLARRAIVAHDAAAA
jgi:hypothetical protein